jgi:hypothetical protein
MSLFGFSARASFRPDLVSSGGFLFPTQESCLLVARVPFCLVSRADFAARSFLLLILLPPIKGIVCGPVLFLVIVLLLPILRMFSGVSRSYF